MEFKIVLLPMEYQLRDPDNPDLRPQTAVRGYLDQHRIPYDDGFPYFKRLNRDSKAFFLYSDSMHLSKEGHRVIFEMLSTSL